MEIAEDLGLTTYTISAQQIPTIIFQLFGFSRPFSLPTVDQITLPSKPIDQVILIIIDNLSLYEIITYQPEFMIKNLENLLLIETGSKENALSHPMLESIFFSKESLTFNLISSLSNNGKSVKVIAREEELSKITIDSSFAHAEKSDVNIYVQAMKAINRCDFLVLHFADLDEMYTRYSMNPPQEVAQKVLRRTDKWLSLFWQQAIEGTTLLVIGNDGKKSIRLNLTGRAADWKRANLPIGFIKFPK